jgi:hypothetical protein
MSALAKTTDQRLSEVESRLEGIEYLLTDIRQEMGMHPITAPDAARLVEEERRRASLQTSDERSSDAAPR